LRDFQGANANLPIRRNGGKARLVATPQNLEHALADEREGENGVDYRPISVGQAKARVGARSLFTRRLLWLPEQ